MAKTPLISSNSWVVGHWQSGTPLLPLSSMANYLLLSFLLLICILSYVSETLIAKRPKITIEEATVDDLQLAFKLNTLTSRQLVLFYLDMIQNLNKNLRGVIEVNPDALSQADIADKQRRECNHTLPKLHGIPILLKDTIATKDKLNTTAGSFALLGSIAPRDAGVVSKLRRSGAIILGKASLSEWCHFRSFLAPSGWCRYNSCTCHIGIPIQSLKTLY